jgi:hypothetical protein
VSTDSSPSDLIRQVESLVNNFYGLIADIPEAQLVEWLRSELQTLFRGKALFVLSLIRSDIILEVLPELIETATRDAYAVQTRHVVSRLPRAILQQAIDDSIYSFFDMTDYIDVQRIAELLYHLGLSPQLKHLATLALSSLDPSIHEIGRDFLDMLPE